MKITLLSIGKTQASYLKEGIEIFKERLKHLTRFEYMELADVKNGHHLPAEELKKKESDLIFKYIQPNDILILCDEKGLLFSSVELAQFIQKTTLSYTGQNLTFVIGGSFGFDSSVYAQAKHQISLSKMTFTHQMVRLIILEQLYRAHTIIKGIPYHNT